MMRTGWALTIDRFRTVASAATILLVVGWPVLAADGSGFNVIARDRQNNQPTPAVAFGTITHPFPLAQQYLEVNISTAGFSDWVVEMFTNNTGWQGGGEQRGGLVDATQRDRLPLMWQVYHSVQSQGPVFDGDPAKWAYLKDKGDVDYRAAQASGYVRIASLQGLGSFPSSGRPFTQPSVFVYLGAVTQGRSGGMSYRGTIGLDFLAVPIQINPPRIVRHVPFTLLHRQRHPILITADVQDDTALTRAVLHVRRAGTQRFLTQPMAIRQVGRTSYVVRGMIPGQAVLTPGVEYTFVVSNGVQETFFQPLAAPQRIGLQPRVSQLLTTHGGRVEYLQGDSEHGMTSLLIPPGALTTPVQIQISELETTDVPRRPSPQNAGAPVTAFRLEPSGLIPQKPFMLTIRYPDVDDSGRISGTDVEPKDLGAFWWDGVEWRFLQRGQLDPLARTVTLPIYHFSDFGLFPVSNVSDLFRPKERIITPNGDGKNDFATFDGLPAGTKVVIFDVTGRVIREFSDVNFWDGKDDQGNVVESGVYIYQVHGPDGLVSGTITVAK